MSFLRLNRVRVLACGLGLILFVLGGVGIAYALGYFDAANDPRIVEIHQLQKKITIAAAKPGKADNRQRFAVIGDLFKKSIALPPSLRKLARAGFQSMAFNRMKQVLAMPHDQQVAALDSDIDLLLMIQKEIEKRRDEARQAKKDAANTANNGQANSTAGQTSGAGGTAGNGSRYPRAATAADRAARHNRMLSSIPAEDRAAWSTYRQMLQARAAQRNIPLPFMGPR